MPIEIALNLNWRGGIGRVWIARSYHDSYFLVVRKGLKIANVKIVIDASRDCLHPDRIYLRNVFQSVLDVIHEIVGIALNFEGGREDDENGVALTEPVRQSEMNLIVHDFVHGLDHVEVSLGLRDLCDESRQYGYSGDINVPVSNDSRVLSAGGDLEGGSQPGDGRIAH